MIEKPFCVPKFCDMHLHVDSGYISSYVDSYFGKVLIVPSPDNKIKTVRDVVLWKQKIRKNIHTAKTIISVNLTPEITAPLIMELSKIGVRSFYFYPRMENLEWMQSIQFDNCLKTMESLDMVLSLHSEKDNRYYGNGYVDVLQILEKISWWMPKLRIVLETISWKVQVQKIRCLRRSGRLVAATIAPQHLILTLDDVIGGSKAQHYNFCDPLPRRPEDRESLREAAISGEPWFFLGSDSTCVKKTDKEDSKVHPGIYSTPVVGEVLMTLFEKLDALDKLKFFASHFASDFHKLRREKENIVFMKTSFKTPEYSGIYRPFLSGETMSWLNIPSVKSV